MELKRNYENKLLDGNEMDAATSYMIGVLTAMPYDTQNELNKQSMEVIKNVQKMQNGIKDKKTLDNIIDKFEEEMNTFIVELSKTGIQKDPQECKEYMNELQIARKRVINSTANINYN